MYRDFSQPPISPFIDEITEIIADLISGLPDYVKQIAADGWETTDYKKWVGEAMEMQTYYELVGYVRDSERDLFRLLAQALVDVTRFSQVVHRHTGQHFAIELSDIDQTLRNLGPYSDTAYDATELWDTDYRWEERSPLYEIVFNAIKKRGHHWYYVNEDLYAVADELKDLRAEDINPLLNDPQQALEHVKRQIGLFLEDYKTTDIDPLDFHQIFEVFNQAATPYPVLLYQRTCGELPKGYPYDKVFYFSVYNGEVE